MTAAHGSWRSPISAEMATSNSALLHELMVAGGALYWLETRPEDARTPVMRAAGGVVTTVLAPPWDARSRVHEYGGGSYFVREDDVYFCNLEDQRLWVQSGPAAPRPLTAAPDHPSAHRYADLSLTPDGSMLVCVRERHEPGGVVNELVAIPTDGQAEPTILAGGGEVDTFYAAPRISPDGESIAWISWRSPQMPWDGTRLWVATLKGGTEITDARLIAGSEGESVVQPEWAPDGSLHFLSDRSGWWNLYRVGQERVEVVGEASKDLAVPPWRLGYRTYCFLSQGRIAAIEWHGPIQRLVLIDRDGAGREPVPVAEGTFLPYLASDGSRVFAVAGGPTALPAVVAIDPGTGETEVLRTSGELSIDHSFISVPEAIVFAGHGDEPVHGLFYAPCNPTVTDRPAEAPPLIVFVHGGPTGLFTASLDLDTQFWTSRGFAVVGVNHGGSAGYGRAYRQRLNGLWGVCDVRDCVAAVDHLAGRIDRSRVVIRGASAGGFTTLCALATGAFRAGGSYCGVTDLAAVAETTHKFEADYVEGLVGPRHEQERYRQRSPVFLADRIDVPVLIVQAMDDLVVPPAQAMAMVDALRAHGTPHVFLPMGDQEHMIWTAAGLEQALVAEQAFYLQVLGIAAGDEVGHVLIEGLP